MSAPQADRNDTDADVPLVQAPQSLRDLVWRYFFNSPQELSEMAFCLSIFALGKIVPILWNWCYIWESPIPYQKTDAGDVILELDLTYDLEASETIPDWLAAVLCVVIPMILFSVVGFCWGPSGDVHASLCFFFVALGLTWFLTDIIKIYAGRLRPNFYDMCEFNKETLQCETDNRRHMDESRKSFPSGHAGLAFGSMTVMTLFFLGKVGLQRNVRSKAVSLRTKCLYLASFIPMLLAVFIATSRIHDFWHHPADVVGGVMIGIGCALFAHGMWYVLYEVVQSMH
jgi:diacylglycerol diphosphate phosphatase/phosphatidate phosphatase